MMMAVALSEAGAASEATNDVEAEAEAEAGAAAGAAISLDPRLRRALLRVLTKLEEEERRRGRPPAHLAMDMRDVVDEEQFVRYFQERGLEKELIDGLEREPKEEPNPSSQEILSYSTDEIRESPEKPFTFASYPEDKGPPLTPKPESPTGNEVEYPSTAPTPPLDNAIYFQIPEPVHVPDVDDGDEEAHVGTQDVRSIRGPTPAAPVEDDEGREAEQNEDEEERKVSFVRPDEPQKNKVREEDEDEERTEVDVQASNSTEAEGNSTVKVEFLTAPLLAAFTVQQDQQGLPRRVIPLNYQASGEPIPLPDGEQALQEQSYQRLRQAQREILFQTRLKELERQRQFQQQYDFQQNQLAQSQQNQLAQSQQNQLAQSQQLQNQPNQLVQQNQLFQQNHQAHQNQLVQQNQQSQLGPQSVHLQKSVDFQFQPFGPQPAPSKNILQSPSTSFEATNAFQADFGRANRQDPTSLFGNFGPPSSHASSFSASPQGGFRPTELNRVNRHEPSGHVGNFGPSGGSFAQPSFRQSDFLQSSFRHRFAPQRQPVTLDNQLQSLFSITGLAGGALGAQEDLNIVSKVLALGHGEQHRQVQEQRLQNQELQTQQFQNQLFQNPQQSQNHQQFKDQQLQNQQFQNRRPSQDYHFQDQQFQTQQFQASTRHESVVDAIPSRVIQPPIL